MVMEAGRVEKFQRKYAGTRFGKKQDDEKESRE
jgi:ribosomal protein L31